MTLNKEINTILGKLHVTHLRAAAFGVLMNLIKQPAVLYCPESKEIIEANRDFKELVKTDAVLGIDLTTFGVNVDETYEVNSGHGNVYFYTFKNA